MHIIRGKCSYKTISMEMGDLDGYVFLVMLVARHTPACVRFNDRVKQGVMEEFDDIVLVTTLLSGVVKRVPWVTVQVLRFMRPHDC